MNLNKVYIIGRLTQDPETRATPAGQSVTTLRLATNRTWNDASGQRKESVEYHTVIAWQRLGEIAAKYLRKGGLVLIEGRIQTRSWTGNDNVKRYFTEIIAENLQLGPRPAGYSQEPEIPIINADEPVNPPMMVEEDETKIKEEDLPF